MRDRVDTETPRPTKQTWILRSGRIGRMVRLGALAGMALASTAVAAGSDGGAAGGAEAAMTHRMMVLALQLGIILFTAKLGAGIIERMGLPGVLGEIIGGIVVGPYLLGAIPLPNFPDGLFPPGGTFPVSPELYGFCSIAAVVLLFDTGLETDVSLFMRYSIAGSLVGLGGVVVSFLLGDLTAVACSRLLFAHPIGFTSPPALFLGVMSTATSVGITARILSERGKIDSPEGVTILAGAVIDDVLGIILLAVTVGMVTASRRTGSVDWGHIGVIAGKAVSIWLVATIVGLFASHRISILLKLFRDHRTIAIMALGLALILAGLFEEAGLAMIIGAYVMGLSLARADICHLIREKLEPIAAFLVPVFFVVMGMLVDWRLILSRPILLFGGIYTATAVLAKIVGCGVPALLCGFTPLGAMRIGAGMLPRGEVALIVAGIGLAANAVNREVFGVGVLMTLATTLMAPPLLLRLLRADRPGLRSPPPPRREKPLRFPLPSRAAADILTSRILDIFDSDGFFVHAIDREAGTYQMRKHQSIVTLRREAGHLVFDCADDDRGFVQTAVLEVITDLRRTAADLAKPIDRSAFPEEAATSSPGVSPRAALAAHLDPACLEPHLRGTTKQEIIAEMVDVAARAAHVPDIPGARAAILAREHAASTGMQHGIALPHARTRVMDRIVCAIGIKADGVDFDSLDGEPSRIIVLVLSPADAGGPHVRFLATIGRILDDPTRAALLACRTAADMYRVLTAETPRLASGPPTKGA